MDLTSFFLSSLSIGCKSHSPFPPVFSECPILVCLPQWEVNHYITLKLWPYPFWKSIYTILSESLQWWYSPFWEVRSISHVNLFDLSFFSLFSLFYWPLVIVSCTLGVITLIIFLVNGTKQAIEATTSLVPLHQWLGFPLSTWSCIWLFRSWKLSVTCPQSLWKSQKIPFYSLFPSS